MWIKSCKILTLSSPAFTVDLGLVVAGVASVGDLVIEEETVWAQVLTVHPVPTLAVPVALAVVWVVFHTLRGAALASRCRRERKDYNHSVVSIDNLLKSIPMQ